MRANIHLSVQQQQVVFHASSTQCLPPCTLHSGRRIKNAKRKRILLWNWYEMRDTFGELEKNAITNAGDCKWADKWSRSTGWHLAGNFRCSVEMHYFMLIAKPHKSIKSFSFLSSNKAELELIFQQWLVVCRDNRHKFWLNKSIRFACSLLNKYCILLFNVTSAANLLIK